MYAGITTHTHTRARTLIKPSGETPTGGRAIAESSQPFFPAGGMVEIFFLPFPSCVFYTVFNVCMAYPQPGKLILLRFYLKNKSARERESMNKRLGPPGGESDSRRLPRPRWVRSEVPTCEACACACALGVGLPCPVRFPRGLRLAAGAGTHRLRPGSACSPPLSPCSAWSACFWPTESSMASNSGCEAVGRATLRSRCSTPAGTMVSLARYEASLSSWRSQGMMLREKSQSPRATPRVVPCA